MIKAFFKAARLRTLPLSVSGIIVGSALASAAGCFNIFIFVFALITTIGFQVLSNFANDYGDGIKGTDNEHRIGPQRALQSGEISPKQMLRAIIITAIITFIVSLVLIYEAFGKQNFVYLLIFLLLGIASIAAAIKYTVGSKAYGYKGMGDLFVFLFFGLLSVLGSYFLYTKKLNFWIILPAISIGLLSVGVLNLNNLRDRESDIKSNKRTLIVKIGDEFGKYYHYYLLLSSFLMALLYVSMNFRSVYQFLFVLAYIPIALHGYTVYTTKDSKMLDPELKKLALSTFLFALLFAIGQLM